MLILALLLIGFIILFYLYKKGATIGKIAAYAVCGAIAIFGLYAWIHDISRDYNYLEGEKAVEAGEYQKAIDYFNKALKLEGDTTSPVSNFDYELAIAYYYIGQYELSKKYYDRAVKTNFWLSTKPKPDTSILLKKLSEK